MGYMYEKVDANSATIAVAMQLKAAFNALGLKASAVAKVQNATSGLSLLEMAVIDPADGKRMVLEIQSRRQFTDGYEDNGNIVSVMPREKNTFIMIPFNHIAQADSRNSPQEQLTGIDVVAGCVQEHLKTGKCVYKYGSDKEAAFERNESQHVITYFQKPM